jgi:hypothetical protein
MVLRGSGHLCCRYMHMLEIVGILA